MAIQSNRKPASLRTPALTKTAVVDLGASSLRVAEVEIGGDGEGRILRKGKAELPFAFWNSLTTSGADLTAALREALSSAGIVEKSVSVGLPRRLVTLRQVQLPHAPPDQLRSMVAFEAQQYILFSIDEVILDYFVVPDAPGSGYGDDMTTVMLAAAQRSIVGEIITSCERAGLSVKRLTVSALALAENAALETEPTAILDIEPGEVDVAMVSQRRLLFTRASTLEPSSFTSEGAGQRLADEISRSLTAYSNEFRSLPLQQILLAGSAEQEIQVLEASLPDLLELPVRRLRTRIVDTNEAGAYATAVGIALQSRTDGIGQINLIPRDREEKRAASAKRQTRLAGAAAGVLVLGAGLLWLQAASAKAQKQALLTRQANLDLQEITSRLDAKKKSVGQLQEFASALTGGIARRQPLVDVLYALDDCVPHSPDIWLTQTNFERGGTITLRGETKNEMSATDFVLALQRSGAFSEVRLGYLGEAQSQEASQETPASPVSVPKAAVSPVLPGAPALPSAGNARPPLGGPPSNVPPLVTGGAKPVQPNSSSVVKPTASSPPVTKPGPKRTPRTSFIITCRLNESAKTLLPDNRDRKTSLNLGKKPLSITKSSSSPSASEPDDTEDKEAGTNAAP